MRPIPHHSPTPTALLLAWEALVRLAHIPHYTLPAPSLVLQTLAANFGSLAGLPPAAMRYTEARLSSVAAELLDDLDRLANRVKKHVGFHNHVVGGK